MSKITIPPFDIKGKTIKGIDTKITNYKILFDKAIEPIEGGGRIKSKVLRVGTVSADGQLQDWTFDFSGKSDGIGIEYVSDDEIYYGGYTVDELREIAEKKSKIEKL